MTTTNAPNNGVQVAPRWTWITLVTVVVLLLVVASVKSCNDWRAEKKVERAEKKAADAAAHPPAPSATRPIEALVLEHECLTPCSTNINYKFKVIWGDSPLRIVYPGGITVDRHGKDEDFQAPSFNSGEVKFASLDPLRPNFRVQVYKVTRR